jgi:hypothetical protein
MQLHSPTTPYGRRSLTLAHVAAGSPHHRSFETVCRARPRLGMSAERRAGTAPSSGQLTTATHPSLAVGKKLLSTPYLFAQWGAYSRGRPMDKEDGDQATAQPLANRRAPRSACLVPSIAQLE